jgi:hypothetical protein
MQVLLAKTITTLGFLIIVTGIYKIYRAIKPESKTYILSPGEEPFIGAIIDHRLAREGIRFLIYGFLIQTLKLIL